MSEALSEVLLFALKGFGLGLALAAPVGPIGLLCLRRSLHDGFRAGFVTGCGAATADGFYALTAILGLTAVSALLLAQQDLLSLLGGLFLAWLGLRTFLARPAERAAQRADSGRLLGQFAGTFLLTLANPLTIVTFLALFGGLGLVGAQAGGTAGLVLVAGVFAGSLAWWGFLAGTAALLRERLGPTLLLWINRLSGLLLLAFAAWMLARLLPAGG